MSAGEVCECRHHVSEHRGNGACVAVIRGDFGEHQICPCNDYAPAEVRAHG